MWVEVRRGVAKCVGMCEEVNKGVWKCVGLWGRLEKIWVELCRGVGGDKEKRGEVFACLEM